MQINQLYPVIIASAAPLHNKQKAAEHPLLLFVVKLPLLNYHYALGNLGDSQASPYPLLQGDIGSDIYALDAQVDHIACYKRGKEGVDIVGSAGKGEARTDCWIFTPFCTTETINGT